MTTIGTPTERVIGRGGPREALDAAALRAIVEEALSGVAGGSRVLAIVPDRTRDDNTPLLFPMASQFLRKNGIRQLDVLIAQGTHAAMTDGQKQEKLGCGLDEVAVLGRVFDHQWDREDSLVTLGELSADLVSKLTDGLMAEAVPVRLNALLAPGMYDTVLVFGATMPHEVAGFAGGAKYFFPGVAGPDLTHMTHWLGALATIEHIIGRVDTPTRRLIEAAARLVPAPVIAFTSVQEREGATLHTRALFAGDIFETFRRAAEISRHVHIRYTGRRYRRVIALLDPHYDEMWVGGKASYKLGGIIEPGGELVIFAPHLGDISVTHGRLIEKYGYAPLEHVRDMVAGSDELRANLCVAAHLAHVAYGSSRTDDGRVVPRFQITLASAVPEDVCRRVKLAYVDWHTFDVERHRADPDTLVVENAGRDLYLVAPEGQP
jgi:nickel-dependent lactate racemase